MRSRFSGCGDFKTAPHRVSALPPIGTCVSYLDLCSELLVAHYFCVFMCRTALVGFVVVFVTVSGGSPAPPSAASVPRQRATVCESATAGKACLTAGQVLLLASALSPCVAGCRRAFAPSYFPRAAPRHSLLLPAVSGDGLRRCSRLLAFRARACTRFFSLTRRPRLDPRARVNHCF